MKKYNVAFSFDEEFRITFQHGNNEIIPFTEYNSSLNSKDDFFKKIENGQKFFDHKDSFLIGQEEFTSLNDLINHLKNIGVGIRFVTSTNKEQKLEGEIDCDNCEGTGELGKKDRFGDPLICYQCDGRGKKKIWKWLKYLLNIFVSWKLNNNINMEIDYENSRNGITNDPWDCVCIDE